MKCIGFCERDKFAVKSYCAMYDTRGEWYSNDIIELKSDDIPWADIWTAGSPCQDVSIAGKRLGLHGNRSGLFFKLIELLKGKEEKDKPEWIIFENVKGLLSSNKGYDFLEYLSEISECRYNIEWQIFNSKNYGVPQNRERVYTIGHLRARGRQKILPIRGTMPTVNTKIVGDICKRSWRNQMKGVYSKDGISPCLNTRGGGNLQLKATEGYQFCNDKEMKIRKLTPRECFRLQGFPDKLFDRAQAVNSDTQLYKQAGNAVTVNVVCAIGKKIIESLN